MIGGNDYEYYIGTRDACVVCVHGGAWMIGSTDRIKEECVELQKEGFHVVAPRYTLISPTKLHSQTIVMTFAAFMVAFSLTSNSPTIMFFLTMTTMSIIWLLFDKVEEDLTQESEIIDIVRESREKYSKNIILMGHSAGAHLAALVGCRLMRDVCGVVCISGVYSGERLRSTGVGQVLIRSVFNENVTTRMPINQVTADTPPHFLINASWDWDLPLHSQDYANWLLSNQVYVQHQYYDGNHFSLHKNWSSTNIDIKNDVVTFMNICIQRNLKFNQ